VQSTLTVLFTDAVASTEALGRLGDERFGVVQQEHLDLLRGSVGACGGREVKSLGDGLMVAFSGAADALACAVAMQQAIEAARRGGEEGLPLRVGVSSGDVSVADDGDVTGTAVVEAARLCAAANGGQILVGELVRGLAGSRGGHAFTPLGPVVLKGLAEPVSVAEVGWAPVAEGGAVAPVPLPPRLAFESSWEFVGRSGEVQRIDALWQDAVGGARRVALLGGEPGEGKTRLSREVAVRAHEQGALVLFGRVDEDLAVAYQPFAEALGHYLASVDEPTRERVLRLRGGVLARLVPELVEEQPPGQVEAWAIYEGLVDWLAGEAAQRPVVLVLDDIHWAAKATLGALMHLVRSERLGRILVVGTYRDTELARTHPLAEALADLRREEGVERLAIRGLDAEGVGAFVQAARGDTLDDGGRELADLLVEQTQGNPFFVGQVLRHLAESGAVEQVDGRWVRTEAAEEFVVPEGVREVVGRRISRLSSLAGELLTVAAVAGPQFDTAIVAQVASTSTASRSPLAMRSSSVAMTNASAFSTATEERSWRPPRATSTSSSTRARTSAFLRRSSPTATSTTATPPRHTRRRARPSTRPSSSAARRPTANGATPRYPATAIRAPTTSPHRSRSSIKSRRSSPRPSSSRSTSNRISTTAAAASWRPSSQSASASTRRRPPKSRAARRGEVRTLAWSPRPGAADPRRRSAAPPSRRSRSKVGRRPADHAPPKAPRGPTERPSVQGHGGPLKAGRR